MVKIDLVTGFLGSGKTTFIRKYASYLMDKGYNIGILENDFGAVNVDMMLLQELMGDNCELEMVAGGCDYDCHKRRFKTKLISMGMCGYDRVIVEPSGIYDVDEFFDVLHEEPLDRWYEIGNVITIVNAGLEDNMSQRADYMLASQVANAGSIIFSRTDGIDEHRKQRTIGHLNSALEKIQSKRRIDRSDIIEKNWDEFNEEDLEKIMNSGYSMQSYEKIFMDHDDGFESKYFMNSGLDEDKLERFVKEVFGDKSCGEVFRIKGFVKANDGSWLELNATINEINISPIKNGQEVIIVIGEDLNEQEIEKHIA